MSLWKYSQREITGRPGRAILTLLSIVIGVGTAVSVSLSIGTARSANLAMVETVSGHAALQIVALDGSRFAPEVASEVTRVPGVASATPTVRQGTKLYITGKRGITVAAVGTDFDPPPPDLELREGRFPKERDEVALNGTLAAGAGIKVGDAVRVLSPKGGGLMRIRTLPLTVVGLVRLPVAANFGASGGLFLSLEGISQLLFGKLEFDSIDITVDKNASVEKVMQEVNRILPEGLVCRTPPGRAEAAQETLLSVQQGLDFASALSLAMAAFIILNTFLMNLGERRRSLAIMRAIGATRAQIVRMMLREGLALGIVGTILGVPVGILGAEALMKVMEGVLRAKLPDVQPTLGTVTMAIVLGPLVSVVAAVIPAFKAGKVSPLEVMNPVSAGDTEKFPIKITVTALFAWILGLVLMVATIEQWLPSVVMIPTGVLMLIAFVLLIPMVLGPFAEFVAWLGRRLMGIEGRLATRQLLRKRVRTTLTVSLLVVAVSNGIGIGNTVIINIQDVRQWHRRTFLCDFVLRPAAAAGGSSLTLEQTEHILQKVREIPGVEQVETTRFLNVRAGGMPAIVIARDFAHGKQLPFDRGAGDPDVLKNKLQEGQAVVGTVLAMRTGLKPGDQITIEAHARTARVEIAGLADDYMTGGLAVYLDADTARKRLAIEGADLFLIKADQNRLASVQAALAEMSRQESMLLQEFADLRRMLDNILNGVIGCFWGLLALGFVVASFGIVNTLTMNVLEQTRELGLLRAVGMTRRQIRKMMLCQAVILGVMGAVLGVLAGITTAYIINVGNQPLLGHPVEFKLHVNMLLLCLGGAFALVTLASYFPSKRAANLDLVEALAYE